jgi:uncharacterized protein
VTTMSEHPPRILWSLPGEHAEQDCACAESLPEVKWSLPVELAETDCACANPAPALAVHQSPQADQWHIAAGLYRADLPDAHEFAFNPVGPAGVVVLNQPARGVLDRYQWPQPLTDTTSRQLAMLNLLMPADQPQPAVRSASMTLTAWLHVTNACNLRCTYCYLHKTNEAMSEETGRAAVDAIFRSALANGFRAVKLKYAGGEATLNFRLIQHLHDYARQQARQNGLDLREVVLSNGVALPSALLDWLHTENVRLMISLDGIGDAHDAQRVFFNGRGSFEWVARGLDRALAVGLTPHLSITVTAHNADRLAETVAFAVERDLPFNLNFFRDNGCTATVADLTADNGRLIAGMKAAFAVLEARLPRRRVIDALVDRSAFYAPHDYPCGAGRNYLVIDHYGRVARCQMEIEQTVTDVLAEDPLALIRRHSNGFQNTSADEKEGCRDCAWRYWCAGGCPLLTYRATGRSDVKSPYCNVYQALYPDVLKLEALRLMKWHAEDD